MPPSPPYDPRHMARLLASMVPDDIAKSIDSAEFHDRIVEAARLSAQAADGSLSPALRQAAKLRAQAVLRAQPRLATRRQHAELIAKASAARDPRQAEAVRRQADRLIEEQHPMAPRAGAALQKAKASEPAEPVPVFDANGTLIGICDPDDIQPVAGAQATPGAPAAEAGAPVTKGTRLSVWDGYGRRYVTTRAKIRKTDRLRPGVYDDGPLYAILSRDTGYGTGVTAPEVQARNRGPVNAGGTTGLGQPRRTGPPESYPADGPQRALPGDVPERALVKALGPQWAEVHDWTGALVGAVQRSHITRSLPAGRVAKAAIAQSHANVYDSSRRRVGIARLSGIIPLATLRSAARTGDPRRRAGS
jgi:hypothetical protein